MSQGPLRTISRWVAHFVFGSFRRDRDRIVTTGPSRFQPELSVGESASTAVWAQPSVSQEVQPVVGASDL